MTGNLHLLCFHKISIEQRVPFGDKEIRCFIINCNLKANASLTRVDLVECNHVTPHLSCSDFFYNWTLMQITTFNISLVVHGTVAEDNDFQKVLYGYMWSFTRILG